MEDTLISFETAKLAREKKCHMETLSYFNVAGEKHTCKYHLPDDIVIIKCYTQSKLQKWLREKHSIYITIVYDWHLFDVNIMSMQSNVSLESSLTGITPHKFTTYEDALEAGLIEGLKHIK